MNIRELSEQLEPYIIERRRFYHAIPELSGEEVETTNAIAADLRAMGLQPQLFKKYHGLTAEIQGAEPGKTLILRADIDALPGDETTGLPFASHNGHMHACGHDCHIAMQLGAARILSEHRDLFKGTVRLLFQPGEETSMGAYWSLEEGALEGADAIYGTHIWGTRPAGTIDVTAGLRMAASNGFRITLKGVTAHGSAPHLGADAVTAAASLILQLQMIASRFNNAVEPVVLTVGTIHGGTMYNSIPEKVVMEGSVRHFRKDKSIEEEMRRIIACTASAMKVDYEFDYRYLNYPVDNSNADLNAIAANAVVDMYGHAALLHDPMMMSSEDFSIFMREIPGVFTFIGTRNPALGLTATNHQTNFTCDESVLKMGSALAARFAVDYLKQGARVNP